MGLVLYILIDLRSFFGPFVFIVSLIQVSPFRCSHLSFRNIAQSCNRPLHWLHTVRWGIDLLLYFIHSVLHCIIQIVAQGMDIVKVTHLFVIYVFVGFLVDWILNWILLYSFLNVYGLMKCLGWICSFRLMNIQFNATCNQNRLTNLV